MITDSLNLKNGFLNSNFQNSASPETEFVSNNKTEDIVIGETSALWFLLPIM